MMRKRVRNDKEKVEMKKKYKSFFIGTGCVLLGMLSCACGNNGSTEAINGTTEQVSEQMSSDTTSMKESGMPQEKSSKKQEDTKETKLSVEPTASMVINPYTGDLTPAEGLEFESNGDGTCIIKSEGNFDGDNLILPQTSPAGDIVTGVDEYAFYDVKIDYLVFDNVSMEIKDSAFSSCEFKNLVINQSVLNIGKDAFAYNEKAESVTILNSECTIDQYAFYNTGKHMSFGITDSTIDMEDSAISGSNEETIAIYNSKINMGKDAFAYADRVTDVQFYNCEIDMDKYAFYNTGDSANVVIDTCSLDINDSALSGNKFETLELRNCISLELGAEAIAYSDDLLSVKISGSDMKIGKYTFYNDDSMTEIEIDAGNGMVELAKAACSGVGDDCEKITVSCGTVKLGDDVFAYNDNLLQINITGTIENKGNYMFSNCPDKLVINVNGEVFNKDSFDEN